jgi:hypothetical protein
MEETPGSQTPPGGPLPLSSVQPRLAEEKPHPIAEAIFSLIHSARDIHEAAASFVPAAARQKHTDIHDLAKGIVERGSALVEMRNRAGTSPLTAADKDTVARITRYLVQMAYRADRLLNSELAATLRTSLFQGLFSSFDAFSGRLLTALYEKQPALFMKISRPVPASEVLSFESFDALKADLLRREIDTFRRKSYVEQFEDLERLFDIKLRVFSKWPDFVECSQRRNIMTHCDGVITDQYVQVCRREGYVFKDPPPVGMPITVSDEYLSTSCALLMELGLKLGQTLWRKVLPEELSEADKYLHRVIYGSLVEENWERAKVYAEFAMGLPRMSSDLDRKIATINLAIALKFGGHSESAVRTLEAVDWTGAALDFRLAESVLLEKYQEATALMKQIGKRGSLIVEDSYHLWPLFRDFRATEDFRKAYEEVFGHEFISELHKAVENAAASVALSDEPAPNGLGESKSASSNPEGPPE